MGGTDRVREICIDHNSKTKHRASLQQKLFVLDYIRANNTSLSKAVKHFISIGCTFKISVSTVSDWKVKEAKLRSLVSRDLTSGSFESQNNTRPQSVLLSRRVITTFKYPLIVENMERIVKEYLDKDEIVNETVLITLWKQIAKNFQSTYELSDEFIEKGPSKGFIYRFKVRNGLGMHHERRLNEEIINEKEKLNRVVSVGSLVAEDDESSSLVEELIDPSMDHDHHQQQQQQQQQHNYNNSVSHYVDDDNIDASIVKISQHLERNRACFKYSTGSFFTFVKLYQQERMGMRPVQQHQQQQQQQMQNRTYNNNNNNTNANNNTNNNNYNIPLTPLS